MRCFPKESWNDFVNSHGCLFFALTLLIAENARVLLLCIQNVFGSYIYVYVYGVDGLKNIRTMQHYIQTLYGQGRYIGHATNKAIYVYKGCHAAAQRGDKSVTLSRLYCSARLYIVVLYEQRVAIVLQDLSIYIYVVDLFYVYRYLYMYVYNGYAVCFIVVVMRKGIHCPYYIRAKVIFGMLTWQKI